MAKLPVMHLWTQRFFGSLKVGMLDGEAQGLYLVLLAREWMAEGEGLPDDDDALARLLRVSRPVWERHSKAIRAFFESRNGRIYNETCEDMIRNALSNKDLRAKAGRKGGQSKAKRFARALPGGLLQQKGSSPSPTPTPTQAPTPAQATTIVAAQSAAAAAIGDASPGEYSTPAEYLVTRFGIGWHKATGIAETTGITLDDIPAWEALAKAKGDSLACHLVKTRARPRPEDLMTTEERRSAQQKAEKDQRMAKVLAQLKEDSNGLE